MNLLFSWLVVVWLGGVAVGRRIRDREVASSIPGCSPLGATLGKLFTHVSHVCLCSPSSINWYRLRLGGKVHHRSGVGCAGSHYRRTLRLAANRRHSSTVLTCGCGCTAALKWLLSLTPLYKLSLLYLFRPMSPLRRHIFVCFMAKSAFFFWGGGFRP